MKEMDKDFAKQLKEIQLGLVRFENVDDAHARTLERLERELKTMQDVYQSGNEDSIERLEDLARAGSTVDPKTMIEAL